MKHVLLAETVEWWGYFWIPGRPDDKQPGALKYTPETGLTLSLIEGMTDAEWEPNPSGSGQRLRHRSRNWGVIHGSSGTEAITLLDCREASAKGTLTRPLEISQQRIVAEQALVGIHLNNADEAVFAGVQLEIENLNLWAPEEDTEFVYQHKEGTPKSHQWSVSVQPAESRLADVDGLTADLGRWYQLPEFDPTRSRSSFRGHGTARIRFTSPEPKTVDSWRDIVTAVQDLISFAVDTPCGILTQILVPTDDTFEDSSLSTSPEIFLLTRELVAAKPDERPPEENRTLFTLRNIAFHEVLPKWFAIRRQFRATCNMVVGMMYVDGTYLETDVVTAVAAAEAMHRRLDLPPPLSDDEFSARRAHLMTCLPKSQRSWLSKYLSRNEHTLKERLIELANRPEKDLMQRVIPNAEAWAKAARDARNGIAHEGEAGLELDALAAVVRVTVAVVRMNLMRELGIPNDRVVQALNDNPRLRVAVKLAREFWPAQEQKGLAAR
jgi:hypothetical protein